MSATDDVRRAWTEAGPVPRYHQDWQDKLRREWPTLADALDRLAAEDS